MKFAELANLLSRELGQDQADRLQQIICTAFAAETVYIPQHRQPPEIRPNDTPKMVQQRYGCSRQTAYNWVNRWRK